MRVHDGTLLQGFDYVSPTILPPACDSECCTVCGGTEIRLAGWVRKALAKWIFFHFVIKIQGRLANGSIPTYLQQLEQHVVPRSECVNHWEGQITSRMFCVTADFYDSCDGKREIFASVKILIYFIIGDSGSAILIDSVRQVGYVSFGSMVCGDGSAPAVYGRLEEPSIRQFIFSITGF